MLEAQYRSLVHGSCFAEDSILGEQVTIGYIPLAFAAQGRPAFSRLIRPLHSLVTKPLWTADARGYFVHLFVCSDLHMSICPQTLIREVTSYGKHANIFITLS